MAGRVAGVGVWLCLAALGFVGAALVSGVRESGKRLPVPGGGGREVKKKEKGEESFDVNQEKA